MFVPTVLASGRVTVLRPVSAETSLEFCKSCAVPSQLCPFLRAAFVPSLGLERGRTDTGQQLSWDGEDEKQRGWDRKKTHRPKPLFAEPYSRQME